ncbi:MAG: AbiJ-NTD4 domain-containing protein [Candidatus Hodarchaeota archaeon]
MPVDELPYEDYKCRRWVKNYFYDLEWYEVYDLTEFTVNNHVAMTREYYSYGHDYRDHEVSKLDLIKRINFILERELSGYRFISGILTPISTKAEVDQIEEAVQAASREGLPGAHQHITTALALLGKRPEPDYRNAIKEAISAVESVVKQISGAQSRGLDDALRELSEKAEIHGVLKSGFKKLYGYSSDEDGIRHAILDLPNVGFSEAKYMIVSCSAFVNYLIAKAVEVDIIRSS